MANATPGANSDAAVNLTSKIYARIIDFSRS